MRDPKKENKPTPPEPKDAQHPPAVAPGQEPGDARDLAAPENAAGGDRDPKAISESLRRIRTSGPLIIEAMKHRQERFDEIIAQSIEGFGEAGKEAEPAIPPPPKPPEPPKPPKPPKPPAHPSRQMSSPSGNPPPQINRAPSQRAPAQAPAQKSAPPQPVNRPNPQPLPSAKINGPAATPSGGLQATAQAIAQTAASTVAAAVAATQSVVRRKSGALSGPAVPRPTGNSMQSLGHLPPNGPSTVLVQASGLKPQSGFSSKFGLGLITLAVLLAAGTYFIFRDRLLAPPYATDDQLNLVSSEDQSSQFIRLGEREREQGNYEAAIEQFQRGRDLSPKNAAVRFLLAQTYQGANRLDEALAEYQNLLRIDPEQLEARLRAAGIHRLRGNWGAAYKEYQNIIQLDQNSPQAALALEAIEKYRAENPDLESDAASVSLRNARVARLSVPVLPAPSLGRPPVAVLPRGAAPATGIKPPAALNNRPEERPDPRALADAHKKLGVRYLNVREFRAAINEFLRALNLTPNDQDLCYFIGSSYHGLGQLADAHDYYRRVESGLYLGPAQSGTKQTEKAAREIYKRRAAQGFGSMKNEARSDSDPNRLNKPIANSFKE